VTTSSLLIDRLRTVSDLPTRELIVTDTNPVWIQCRQGANTLFDHCGLGMVFAVMPVNPGPDGSYNSFAAFKAKLRQAVGGLQRHEVLVSSIYGLLSTWTSASTSSANGVIFLNPYGVLLISDNSLLDDVPVRAMITRTSFCLSLDCTYSEYIISTSNWTICFIVKCYQSGTRIYYCETISRSRSRTTIYTKLVFNNYW